MVINFYVIILGLLFGSFLNVAIYRIPRGQSILWPESCCTACGYELSPLDLIPVLSCAFLKGKCRYCGKKNSLYYTMVEVITAIAFLLVFLQWSFSINTLAGWIFTGILITASFIDINEGIIPHKLTCPGVFTGIILSYFTIGLISSIFGTILFYGIFLLIAIISKGGMGGGDIKLAAVIGAFAGVESVFLVFIVSSVMGCLWILFLLFKRNAGFKTAVKFGPFLSLAGFAAYNWAEEIYYFYFKLFI